MDDVDRWLTGVGILLMTASVVMFAISDMWKKWWERHPARRGFAPAAAAPDPPILVQIGEWVDDYRFDKTIFFIGAIVTLVGVGLNLWPDDEANITPGTPEARIVQVIALG